MLSKSCKLEGAGIVCYENKKDNLYWRKPNPELYTNIPMLWRILELIVRDWHREAEPFQVNIDKSVTDNDQYYYLGQAFLELQPVILNVCCLAFSSLFLWKKHMICFTKKQRTESVNRFQNKTRQETPRRQLH